MHLAFNAYASERAQSILPQVIGDKERLHKYEG